MNRGGAYHPLLELTIARLREFVREPEALFWTFIFPIVISVALAIAFPGGRPTPAIVGLEPGPRAAAGAPGAPPGGAAERLLGESASACNAVSFRWRAPKSIALP